MRRVLSAFFILFLSISFCGAQNCLEYTVGDSLKVVRLLTKAERLPADTDLPLFFGRELIGTVYAGGTLDREDEERLVINLHEFDCTTFVETSLALSIAAIKMNAGFKDFTDALRTIRYRDGKIGGYASRLHYFSDWIANNEHKGLLKDVSSSISPECLSLNLHYMSSNPVRYRQLKNNPSLVREIEKQEALLNGKKVPYVSEKRMEQPQIREQVKEGSIIAITTNIDGLDIAHVGFAVRQKGELYLLHASTKFGKVIIDTTPLNDYLKNKSTLTGIRILSVL